MKIYLILLLSSICAAIGQIFLKKGAFSFINWYLFFGGVLYFLGFGLWIYSLSKVNLTLVYAFTLWTFILVYLLSYFFLNESISILSLIGLGFVLLGFSLIVRGQAGIL
ncbi:EamA family transporter [Acinetobacter defluvii]|uniref:EamA family transporter n=1 Tax=Acinetobacter defluvii TaxID=1871111 RepID=UPI003AF9D0B7